MDSPARSQPFRRYLPAPPESFRFCDNEPDIGRKAYGSVHLGELEGRPVAVKRIHIVLSDASPTQGEYSVRSFEEVCIRMESLNHPRLVKFFGAYRDAKGPFLVTERITQNLRQFLAQNRGELKLQKQLQLCLDIATGLHYMHSQETPLSIDRDFNNEYILIDKDGRASVGGLGQSKLKKHPPEYLDLLAPGAPVFMLPEAVSDNLRYTKMVDIFCFGVLMLEIAIQNILQTGLESIDKDHEAERRKKYIDQLPKGHPLKQLILMCLQEEPHRRPCNKELLQRLIKLNLSQAKNDMTSYMGVCLEHLSTFLDQIQGCPAATLAEAKCILECLQSMVKATKQEQMKVVFLGTTSNGKSTILNALIKKKLLPVGRGITTKCFYTITGVTPSQLQAGDHADGYLRTRDLQEMKLMELETLMDLKSIKVGDVLEMCLPSPASSVWLSKDVVLIDSPGLGADDEVDEMVKKTCGDADVFVYVCNGNSTLEEPVKMFLGKVNRQFPNLSKNLFILFNHWDQVMDDEDTDSEKLKRQHLEKVEEFVLNELQANTVLDRTFFVSGKEACMVQENEKNEEQPTEACKVLKRKWEGRWTDFRNFESQLHDCLSGSAIQTKCGRHLESCMKFMEQLIQMMEKLKQWCRKGVKQLTTEVECSKTVLKQVTTAAQKLQQTCKEKVERAVADFGEKSDEFHDSMKMNLDEIVEKFPKKSSQESWVNYFKKVTEDLDEKVKQLIQQFHEKIGEFAIDRRKQLQDAYTRLAGLEEPQAQQCILGSMYPISTEMTIGHRATSWFGRLLLNAPKEAWETCKSINGDHKDVTVEGPQHEKPKRNSSTASSDVITVSNWVALSTLATPLSELSLSYGCLMHIMVSLDAEGPEAKMFPDKLKSVKGKIISHLHKELNAKKQAAKSRLMGNLQCLLESQVENFKAAMADKEAVHGKSIEELKQRIANHNLWITQAKSLQNQLKTEVKPRLDLFRHVYLQ